VVVVVVGMVIVWKMASGALVVGPTNIATLHVVVALSALRLASVRPVMSIRAVQPAVAFVRQSITALSNLPTKHTKRTTTVQLAHYDKIELAPYGTGGRLFPTDLCAKCKVT